MNIFSNCGSNSCLWILLLLLIAASCCGDGIEQALSGSCVPILCAILYTMWKNGSLGNIFCGNGNNNGCCGN